MELSSFSFEKNEKKPIEADLYVKTAVYNINICFYSFHGINRQTLGFRYFVACIQLQGNIFIILN